MATEDHPERPPLLSSTGHRRVRVTALIDHLVMGGAEMLLSQFARVTDAAGIDLSITCLSELDGNPAAIPLRAAGIEPLLLDLPGGRPSLHALRTVRRHLAATRPDVVHTHLGNADLLGGLAARSLGIPVVTTLHNSVWPADAKLTATRLVVGACDQRLIAVSEATRRAYAARIYGRGRRIVTIHNGVDVTPEAGSGQRLRAELGVPASALVVGMVSSLRREKAHDLTLQAVSTLRERHPDLRLVIVGRGYMAETIERQIAELGLADVVVMTGARHDVMRCYDAFDVCVHPSWAEAFPTTLLEAMAAGVPVLATAVGGIPEIVVDGVTGRLVPAQPGPELLADALSELLSSAPLRAEWGDAGRRRFQQRFTAEPWAHATRRLYDELLTEQADG